MVFEVWKISSKNDTWRFAVWRSFVQPCQVLPKRLVNAFAMPTDPINTKPYAASVMFISSNSSNNCSIGIFNLAASSSSSSSVSAMLISSASFCAL